MTAHRRGGDLGGRRGRRTVARVRAAGIHALEGVGTSLWGITQVDSSDETSPFDLVKVAASKSTVLKRIRVAARRLVLVGYLNPVWHSHIKRYAVVLPVTPHIRSRRIRQ